MKRLPDTLKAYIANEKHMTSCDVYELKLLNGDVYRFAAFDRDVQDGDVTYSHKPFTWQRDQIQLQGAPSVDTLTVSVYCTQKDLLGKLPLMKAVHDGSLDQATLTLSKAFFNGFETVGVYPVFSGRCEVATSGGLAVKLSVKSVLQGLASLLPVRVFASQADFTEQNGIVVSTESDEASMLIPLKPSMNVLIYV